MSANGSDFENDGDFIHEPSAKKSRLDPQVVQGHGEVLQLHTGWDSRDDAVRHATAYTTDADGPVPVPQSDFEIEINSTNQDGPTSPGHEITLTSTVSTMPMEPRILTIDPQLPAESQSLVSSDPHTGTICPPPAPDQQTTILTTSSSNETDQPSPTNVPAPHDFTSLIAAAAGRSGFIPQQVSDALSNPADLANSQFILQSQSRSNADGSHSGGPLYVMIPPTSNGADLLQAAMQSPTGQPSQHSLVPRLASGAVDEPTDDARKQKEFVRKQTHNEVERRRRDRINELIKMLAEVVPGCQKKDASSGTIVGYVYSKGTVLEKTVEYVRDLITQNEQLSATAKLAEKSGNALQVLQNQITVLEKENAFLRAQMIQLGIDNSSSSLNTRSLLTNSLTQSLLNSPQVATPPPPAVPNTTQLLMNLAQSLTNNPLLATLNQQPTPHTPPTNDTQNHSAVTPTTCATPPNNVSSGNYHTNMSNLVALNSLAQTLASITGSTSTTLLPPPPQHSSTANAMNILNSLIMAQSALNATTTTTPSAVSSTDTPTTGVSLLVPPQTSPEKTAAAST